MCPDRQIISLYHDGELPSPWKEKMESHLETCAECKAALAGYGSLGNMLNDADEENILAARERVWKKLVSPELVVSNNKEAGFINMPQRYSRKRIWNRSVTIPVPAAAAAALIIIAMLAVGGLRERRSPHEAMAVIPDYNMQVVGNEQGMVPMMDMTSVLQYLSGMDNGDFMVIRLPESKNFKRAGEPALINAADYSRRQLHR